MDPVSTRYALYLVVFLFIFVLLYNFSSRTYNLPKGPPGLPFFGNIFDLGDGPVHFKLTKWASQYGDFFSYKIGRTPYIVLSSPEAINDLFVKRGQKYSSRPKASSQAKLITQEARIVNMPYGENWREHRRVIHSLLGMQTAKLFIPFQEYESRRTLKNLLEEPKEFWEEVSRFSGSITFSLLLSCRFEKPDAVIPQSIGKRMQLFFANIRPGAWLVDWIPILDYLPDALAPWRKQALAVRNQIMPFFLVFHEQMKERVKNGTAPDCFVTRLLTDKTKHFDEVEYSHLIAEMITAGTETTATTLQWFFKAAVLNPDAIVRAQDEIDKVVGADRLPSWEDQPKLPYTTALIQELHRWATATPMAFLHSTSEDDVYREKNIPKGAVIIANAYAIHQSPRYFPQPDKLIPERYLDPKDPRAKPELNLAGPHFAFSAGRRECPGRHVADASLFIMISRILWAFDIRPAKKLPGPGYSAAFPVFGPAPFECLIEPRSNAAAQIILEHAVINRPKDLEDDSIYDTLIGQI
ncbi:hypothetical protein PV08_05292 [Exophiala spinifera]|uniref:Cytochrome P450 n=1 Tax=Exophiala spinifera TaxID=91928 RepID=A0A0D1ZR05_9EURO|nr:uncharacterized protein PV08_05292 [Exophiala spinifera]KIW15247.1 hypothetical protein PV08_05292 [Exophiala spinifera]